MKKYILLILLNVIVTALFAQKKVLETSIPPGKNFDKAEFRLWYADSITLKGILVLMPGSNGDGRDMVQDAFWQNLARKNNLALLGCRFTDKQHEHMDIEKYIDVKAGSGQALINAINFLATQSKHPELENAPLLLWGFSAGGEFNYEFVCWKPERVLAFVVNKGGIYYSALAPAAAREVPGLLLTGEKDMESRTNAIKGIYEMNRRFGAVWCYASEPGMKHELGKTQQLAAMFFNKMIAIRLAGDSAKNGKIKMQTIPPTGGYLGSSKTESYYPATQAGTDASASWLPDTQFADAWMQFLRGEL
ncbi:hypothetical protein EWM62_00485 [Mucilaginibacter terrigena]|uniref:Alpha/beta hydrolase n=1 Tax=Mucilaginibacter terrigena TaxID=2492395 RepID=A0A4Q5LR50_9SPHI|nr:hypothetical protein [Mucilaginibacter terrigena]RYU91952.1 hypothetical protein EWM62_00485 [Mucilaginibacter terrigena]